MEMASPIRKLESSSVRITDGHGSAKLSDIPQKAHQAARAADAEAKRQRAEMRTQKRAEKDADLRAAPGCSDPTHRRLPVLGPSKVQGDGDAILLIKCDTCGDLKKTHCAKKKCKAEREAGIAARSVDMTATETLVTIQTATPSSRPRSTVSAVTLVQPATRRQQNLSRPGDTASSALWRLFSYLVLSRATRMPCILWCAHVAASHRGRCES